MLLLVEWMLMSPAPEAAAVLVYLHIAGLGPVLGSGFWLIASERFDPRTAKRSYSRIAGAGTLGGLTGGLLAERLGVSFGVAAVLPFLSVLNVLARGRCIISRPGPLLTLRSCQARSPAERPRTGLRAFIC